jgi:hypothetical protein
VDTFLRSRRGKIWHTEILGGTGAISDGVRTAIVQALTD